MGDRPEDGMRRELTGLTSDCWDKVTRGFVACAILWRYVLGLRAGDPLLLTALAGAAVADGLGQVTELIATHGKLVTTMMVLLGFVCL
jgi:hypothetical protein